MMKKSIVIACLLLTASLAIAAAPLSRMSEFVPGSRGTVLLFVSSMCPCTDQHKHEVRRLDAKTRSRGINYYCIFSNISENDGRIGQFFKNVAWDMPYVLDTEGTLAKKYGATHTPHAVLLDAAVKPIYRGPIDDSSKNLGRIEHAYLRDHVNLLLEAGTFPFEEVPALGCWLVTKSDINQ